MPARKQKKKNERTATKRENTIKERQDDTKAKFLAKLEETPIIQVAAAQTGIHRSTYYDWRNDDPEFKDACRKAHERGVEFVNDMMESLLIKSAKDGKIAAMIFWLKNHNPQYNDKRYHEHEHHFREDPLTEERKMQIASAMEAWSRHDPEDDDERDDDYEVQKDEDGNLIGPGQRRTLRYDDDGNLIK